MALVITGTESAFFKAELKVPMVIREMTFTLRHKLQSVTLFLYVRWVYLGFWKHKLKPCIFP